MSVNLRGRYTGKGYEWTAEADHQLRKMLAGGKSHKEIGLMLSRTTRAIRNRCYVLGLTTVNPWTENEEAELRVAYERAKTNAELNLSMVAVKLGRTRQFLSRKARAIGLSNHKRPALLTEPRQRPRKFQSLDELRAFQSQRQREYIRDKGHPRGMLGKSHSPETRAVIARHSRAFNRALSPQQKAEMVIKAAKSKAARGNYYQPRLKASWKAGWREIGGVRKYFRSKWEANYARYLQWLKQRGDIVDWQHEPTTFWFHGVLRGAVSYLPDFLVLERGGAAVYHEVKGWMDARSKTKLKRMAKYFPEVTLVVIDKRQYAEIREKLSALIEGWEQ